MTEKRKDGKRKGETARQREKGVMEREIERGRETQPSRQGTKEEIDRRKEREGDGGSDEGREQEVEVADKWK